MVEHLPALVSGALIGLSIAAPVGPMGILCINRTLADGMTIGVITGLGAATVHTGYGAIVFLGLSEAGPFIAGNSKLMSLCGGALMVLFSIRLLRARLAVRGTGVRRTVPALVAYGSAVAFNASNPLTVVLLMGAVTSIFGGRAPTGPEVGLVLLGQFAGSALWWFCLTGATSLLRGHLTAGALRSINWVAAAVLFGFGLVAVGHALQK